MDQSSLTIGGWYLRPSLAYKATTIFGGDEGLKQLLEDGGSQKASFEDFLVQNIRGTSDLLNNASKLSEDFALGKTDNIHEVMIAGEKADIALQLATAVRTKVMDAYNEIIRMQM